MRRNPALVLAVSAALAAGCGSTVAGVNGSGTASVGDGTGLSGPSASAPPVGSNNGLSVPGSTVGPGGGGAVSGGATTTAPVGSAPAPGTVPSSGPAGRSGGATTIATGPGITASTIYFGMEYSSQTAGADRAIGAAGASPSYDYRNVMNSVIDYANSHGGFAGRKLQAVYYDVNVANDRQTEDQAACAKFTQDNKVFAMFGQSDELRACAEKAGAVSVVGGNSVASTFKKFPHFVDPQAIRLDRMGPVTVGGLHKAGYFTGKLGLITWDDPNYRYAMTQGYLPALSSYGIQPATPPIYISVPQQVNALADMTAQVSNAVTKFRAAGVDHVIIQDGPAGVWAGGGITLEFMNSAKSQHYYPRYGQNIYNLPGSNELPADEQNQAIAIIDLDDDPKYDAGWHSNAQRDKCFQIEAAAGLPVSQSNDNDESLAAQTCDIVFFLQQVINALPSIDANSFIRQTTALGTTFKAASVFGTRFFPGRLDGSDRVRTGEYFQSCQCLKFSGPPYQPD